MGIKPQFFLTCTLHDPEHLTSLLTVLPSLWLHLFVLLAFSISMCTDLLIVNWLFLCYIRTNDNNRDNNKCISGGILSH